MDCRLGKSKKIRGKTVFKLCHFCNFYLFYFNLHKLKEQHDSHSFNFLLFAAKLGKKTLKTIKRCDFAHVCFYRRHDCVMCCFSVDTVVLQSGQPHLRASWRVMENMCHWAKQRMVGLSVCVCLCKSVSVSPSSHFLFSIIFNQSVHLISHDTKTNLSFRFLSLQLPWMSSCKYVWPSVSASLIH